MLSSKRFDLEAYFTRGFTVTQVDLKICDLLLEHVKGETFREESKLKPTNPLLPAWDTGERKGTQHNHPPRYISDFWNKVALQDYYSYFHLIYGEFSQLNMMLQKYVKGTKIGWHQDVHEGVHITNVLYLSDDAFSEEDGGFLKLGTWSLDDRYWGIEESVQPLWNVAPAHGTLVSLCNVVPTFCHSVVEMLAEKSRYSLICRFGYEENVRKNKLAALF